MARRFRVLVARWGGPTEVTCRLFDGQHMAVVVPEIVANELYLHGRIEPPLTQLLLARLRPGMVFVDVGAHYGYFSVIASRLVGPAGKVIAFEPGRRAARVLRSNVAQLGNVAVEQAAVTHRTGTARFLDFGPRHCALNTVLNAARVPTTERTELGGSTYEVPTVSLDEYAADHDLRPDLVKLDAEGAELLILQGMWKLLNDVAPIITLETGDYDDMASPPTSASIDFLERVGYAAFEYDNGLQRHRRRRSYGYDNLFFLPTRR